MITIATTTWSFNFLPPPTIHSIPTVVKILVLMMPLLASSVLLAQKLSMCVSEVSDKKQVELRRSNLKDLNKEMVYRSVTTDGEVT